MVLFHRVKGGIGKSNQSQTWPQPSLPDEHEGLACTKRKQTGRHYKLLKKKTKKLGIWDHEPFFKKYS
jgi:hypothetical protein